MPVITITNTLKLVVLALEVIDIAISATFLLYFAIRYHHLQQLSMTSKYTNFFPRLRIIFSIIYIVISFSTLIFSLATDLYHDWYSYFLIGGGGACINSVVMVIQLLVLRQELIKQYPYTRFHIIYFIILAVFSTSRYVWILLINDFTPDCLANLILSILLMFVSIIQFIYWMIKRQSLPQFISYFEFNPETLKIVSFKSDPISEKGIDRSSIQTTNFPLLIPFVSVEDGQIKIVLQITSSKMMRTSLQFQTPSNLLDKRMTSIGMPLLHQSQSIQKRFTAEVVSSYYYSVQELQKLYIACGRFPLKKQLMMDKLDLHGLNKELQVYLQELLVDKKYYQADVLDLLKLPKNYIDCYSQIYEHEFYLQGNQEIDPRVTIKLTEDKNAIYCSVQLFKHLWVSNHYEFYLKTTCPSVGVVTYPIKRYSEFEQLHLALRNMIKVLGKPLELPPLPKKHLFHWNQDEHISKRKTALEKYLKKLSNDYTLMQVPQIRLKVLLFLGMEGQLQICPNYQDKYYRHLQIMKGQITKVFVKNEYVTFYEFLIFRGGVEINKISKRYSEFDELHTAVMRWMKNIRITYNFIQMPEKVYFKSEVYRHEKLRTYLQHISEAREIGKVYAVNAFFNIFGDQEQSIGNISAIDAMSRSKKSASSSFFNGIVELQENAMRPVSSLSQSSGRFSRILDDLGNQSLD